MPDVSFIACDPLVGLPRIPMSGQAPSVDDLRREMHRLRLHAAIVRHRHCLVGGPYTGNELLMEEIAGDAALWPAWVLTPEGTAPEFDIRATVRHMLAAGVKVAWMAPTVHDFSPLPWCAGALYAALSDARVPLLVEYEQIHPDHLHQVCVDYPDLRIILLKAPRLGRNRMLYPLLDRHRALHLCFSPSISVHEGFVDLCDRFGPHRWVFGMGYPEAEGGAGIAGLTYAGLPAEAVRAIAGGTITRLLGEVRDER